MMFKFARILVIVSVLFFSVVFCIRSYAQSPSTKRVNNNSTLPQETQKRLLEIYTENKYSPRTFRATWLPDSKGYIRVEIDENRHALLARYNVEDGKRMILFSTGKMNKPPGSGTDFMIDGFQISDNGQMVFIQINKRQNDTSRTEFLLLDLTTGKITQIAGGGQNKISPDGKKNIFTREGNLFLYDKEKDSIIMLTNEVPGSNISNEQVTWSPDSKNILFLQTDQSKVRIRHSLLPGDPTYPKLKETRYARIGEPIPDLRIGVINIVARTTKWVPLEIPSDGFYIGQMSWVSPTKLMVEKLNRFRTHRSFLLFDIRDGSVVSAFEETDPDWVVASYNKNGGFEWMEDRDGFLFLSEKDGWRHAYIGSVSSRVPPRPLTPGAFDIIDRLAVDKKTGWFYYHASPENGTQKYLYRVRIDGKRQEERVTPANQSGTHDYVFSPDANWAFHTYSNSNTAPVTELVKFPEYKIIRVLEDNHHLKEKSEEARLQPKEFLKIDIGENIVMDAWMIKPRDFDSSKKYPLFVYVYGEPHAQTVIDEWENAYAAFHRAIADLGYIVVSIDNRGTPCPKGAAWRRAVSGSLGPLSTEEQAEGVIELGRKYSYIDLSRVGIWGWSGGGSNTLNALFRRPDVYSMGIAVAPKPQPWLYNAWFQEIYMKTPEVNQEGYLKSAPINFADGLKGDLLIIHGTGETNTHIQITEGLVDRMIELGKSFDYMTYPDRDHGIREKAGTSLHLRSLIVRYLMQHLPAGPAAENY